MAKIVYFISPFDDLKKIELESNESIGEVLIKLNIENEPLSVILNGVCPEECDLDYKIRDLDTLEIRRIVNGEGSSSNKRDLATIIQIAALVAVTIISGGASTPYTSYLITGILVASSIVSGALLRRSAELAMGDNSGAYGSDSDIATNSYSLTNITNEARPLSSMPLVMGSHLMAPDIITNPFTFKYYNVSNPNTIAEQAPTVFNDFIPGIVSGNGATATDNSWASMSADFIASGFPQYDIKISPAFWGFESGPLTTAENNLIINDVKSKYLSKGSQPSDWNFNFYNIELNQVYSPLVIYHSDVTDPYYGRYNLFNIIARSYEVPDRIPYSKIGNLFSGTRSDDPVYISGGGSSGVTWAEAFFFSGVTPDAFTFIPLSATINILTVRLIKVGAIAGYYFPNTLVNSDNSAAVASKVATYLMSLNDGNLTTSNKTSSFATQRQYVTWGITSVNDEGVDASTQIFNYGIGDLTITEQKIEDVEVDTFDSDSNRARYSNVKLTNTPGLFKQWQVPMVQFINDPYGAFFYHDVKIDERKKLSNIDSPTSPISLSDDNTYNFSYFESKYGHDVIRLYITGRLYKTNTTTGFESNETLIEAQWKFNDQTTWNNLGSNSFFKITNDNTKTLNHIIESTNQISIPSDPDKKLQMRVRKITLDSVDNANSSVCDLYLDKVVSTKTNFGWGAGSDAFAQFAPQNLVGVFVTSLISNTGRTSKFNSIVESKCWVFDFTLETWSWTYSRNPAFWFLFYARGGFLNLPSSPSEVAPYSPTWGWQNYPGHPDNTERIFGVGLTDDKIDMIGLLAWAEFCEDQSLNFDLVLKDDTSCSEVLERIANVGRGSVTYYSGKLSVVWEDPEQIPTCLFGMGNIKVGSFAVTYKVSEPVRKVIINYIDRTTWESEFVEALVPYSDAENINFVELKMEGITDKDQAQREANILASRQFFQRRTYSWEVDIEGLIAKRGDLVFLSHDSTQYGFSGRIKRFIVEAGVVTGIETTAILDSSVNFITIKEPNGDMNIYACHYADEVIYFDEVYPIEKASKFISNNLDNMISDYADSIPEDFTFISGAKETPGKLVRISEISTTEDFGFRITAIDEDPAMWANEYDIIIPSESFDDAEVVLSVTNVQYKDLGGGLLKINWENVNGDMITILNKDTMLPIEASGSLTFTGGEVILELLPDTKYDLILRPFAIGTPYISEDKRIKVWLQ